MAVSSTAVLRSKDVVSWPLMIGAIAFVGALATSSAVGTAVLAGCICVALVSPLRAIQALTVATLVAYGNPAIIKAGAAENVLVRLVLLAAVLRMLPTIRGSDLRILWPVWLFSVVEALTSLQTSPAVDISMLKVLEFICGITAVLVAYNHVKPSQLAGLQRWMITVGLTVIGLSALTLLKPSIGLGGDQGLQGILNQPQALGIFMAPFAAWAIAGTLLMRRSATRLELWMALVLVVLIVLSKARTAGFGAGLGVIVVVATRALGRRRAGQATLGRPILICLLACIALAGFAATTGGLSKIVNGYLYKGTEGQVNTLNQAFYNSRGGGALGEWDDFLAKPVFGNGFGVYPDGHFPSGVTRVDGIPISAPIEKGFLPTAILQEGGAVGGALLLLIIGLLCVRTWRNTDLRWRAMFIACLGINVGECVFMSPGGIGIFDWLLLSLAMFSYRTTPPLPRALEPSPQADLADVESPTLAKRPEPQFGM
jgi:hypothetical protein